MTQRMLDTTNPPTSQATYEALQTALGANVIALYVPGWGATTIEPYGNNSVAAGKAALAAGWTVLPILDPDHNDMYGLLNAGQAAMNIAVQFALNFLNEIGANPSAHAAIAFDIEESDYTANPSLATTLTARFYIACQSLGVQAAQYGNPNFLEACAGLPESERPESVWVASWNATAWPTAPSPIPVFNNSLWTGAGQRGWQWGGGSSEGFSFDYSVIDFAAWGLIPPAPTPTPTPTPTPSEQVLVAGTPYQTPKGDIITFS